MSDLNPLTLGDTPDEYTELPDGSVEISDIEGDVVDNSEFYTNLAETLDESELGSIASELLELIEKDKQARSKRDEQYEEGIRRTGLGNDAPGGAEFEGASRVVHPVLAESCVDFASSAIKELFPPSGPVKTEFVGDVDPEQAKRGERKRELMNWQLSKQMPEYIDELEQLLSQMPMGGSQYLKMRYDEDMRRPVAEFVPIDEILVPFAATNFYTAPRVTHRQMITRYTLEKRVNSGFYRDIDLLSTSDSPEFSSASMATDKIEGVEESGYNEDGLRAILEIYTWRELKDDSLSQGGYAPYVIHIDEYSEKVLAVYRNWDEQDQTMEKLDWMVEFKFIPWRGAYAIGLPHLIGGLAAGLTGALRALLDSAHINNAPSLLKLRGARMAGQNTEVNMTEVTEIECPPNVDDIRKLVMPMPFNQPSPVLFQLLGYLDGAAKGVVSTAEEKIADAGNQMPVGTAMALIEQGSKVFSAIHARLHRSQAKVLEILHRINSKWLDEEEQKLKLGKVVATRQDFIGSMDVIPASDPNIFSETQRFAQLQALLQMSQDPRAPWQINEIYHRLMDLMHVPQAEKLLPKVPEPMTSNVLEENKAISLGKPVKADEKQDHLAHIQGHIAFASSPMVLNNPLVNPAVIQGTLGHVNEHMMALQYVTCQAMKMQLAQQAQTSGVPVTEDQLEAAAVAQTGQVLSQQLQPVMQQIGMIQQQLQSRMPPPQMPPEVQASIQIAQMETDRRTKLDQATLGLKQAEDQARQAAESARLQMESANNAFEQRQAYMQQQFEQFLAQQEASDKRRSEELQVQIDLLRNQQDNRQHQMTELLKNHEDNQTAIIIEKIKQTLAEAPALNQPAEPQTDMGPQLQQLQVMLDQIGKQQTNDALSAVVDGLRATMEHLGRPKMLIKDNTGKTVGIQTV